MIGAALAVCLVSAPRLAATIPDADVVAWAQVDEMPRGVARLRESPLAGVLDLFAPAATIKGIAGLAEGEALITVGLSEQVVPSWRVLVGAGPMAPTLKELLDRSLAARGYRKGADELDGWKIRSWRGGPVPLVTGEAGAQFGLASDVAALSGMTVLAGRFSVASTERFARLQGEGAPAFGWVDVKRLYGRLARGPNAGVLAANLARAGLLPLEGIEWRARIDDDGVVRGRAEVLLPGDPIGLFGALGDPHPPVEFRRPPRDLLSVTRASVRPLALLQVINRLFSYNKPIQYGLWQAQLGAVEQGVAKRLDLHALGTDSRVWTLYRFGEGNATGAVLEAEVADGQAARVIAAGLVASLPSVMPTARVHQKKVSGREVMVFGGSLRGALAFDVDRVWVASDEKALSRALSRKSGLRLSAAEGPGALISGYHRDVGQALARMGGRKSTSIDHVRWAMTRAEGGYGIETQVVGRR